MDRGGGVTPNPWRQHERYGEGAGAVRRKERRHGSKTSAVDTTKGSATVSPRGKEDVGAGREGCRPRSTRRRAGAAHRPLHREREQRQHLLRVKPAQGAEEGLGPASTGRAAHAHGLQLGRHLGEPCIPTRLSHHGRGDGRNSSRPTTDVPQVHSRPAAHDGIIPHASRDCPGALASGFSKGTDRGTHPHRLSRVRGMTGAVHRDGKPTKNP